MFLDKPRFITLLYAPLDTKDERYFEADCRAMVERHWYRHRTGVLATMHRKEQVIAPLFATEFSIPIIVPPEFDTDYFGTFTRDIQRWGTQLETARAKAKAALAATGETLAIASEGSFGPHPQLPWIASNREMVLLIDSQYNFEVYADHISLKTNYEHADLKSLDDAIAFAQKTHFPSHALVVMTHPDQSDPPLIYKGITDWQEFTQRVQSLLQQSAHGLVRIETDMRALFNPTRMEVIQHTTQLLLQKLKTTCPVCNCPGFDVVDTLPGRPCAWCHAPTPLIQQEIYRCQHCAFQEKISLEAKADPMYCPHCNP